MVDRIAYESYRSVSQREIGSTRMVRLESPRYRPIHLAAALIARWIRRSVAAAGTKTPSVIIHSIDFPVHWLNGLPLRDKVARRPTKISRINVPLGL